MEDELKHLQEEEIRIHEELLKHVKNEGNKKFFELLRIYVDINIELENLCNI